MKQRWSYSKLQHMRGTRIETKDFLQTVTGKIKIAKMVFKNGDFEEKVIFSGDVLDLKKIDLLELDILEFSFTANKNTLEIRTMRDL